MIITISDTQFKHELDQLLKRQKIKKADRNNEIEIYMRFDVKSRNDVLDEEDRKARAFEEQKRLDKLVPSEFTEQCNFVKWFNSEFPDVWIYSNRNHGTRTPREKTDQLLEGLLPGVADLYVPKWQMYIEFKRVKGGKLSDAQESFKSHVMDDCNGYYWITAHGCEDGKTKVLDFYRNIELYDGTEF